MSTNFSTIEGYNAVKASSYDSMSAEEVAREARAFSKRLRDAGAKACGVKPLSAADIKANRTPEYFARVCADMELGMRIARDAVNEDDVGRVRHIMAATAAAKRVVKRF